MEWSRLSIVNICTSFDGQEGPGVNTLIVATDSPLLWRSASSFSSSFAAASAAREPAGGEEDHLDEGVGIRQRAPPGRVDGVGAGACGQRDEERKRSPFSDVSRQGSRNAPPPSWSAHPREVASLLSLLFSWAAADNYDGDKDAPAEAPTTTAEREVPAAAVAPTVASGASSSGGSSAQGASSQRRNRAATAGTGQARGARGRVFSVVCPATRVRRNIQSYVKDRETGRVATQWCLASKDTGERVRCCDGWVLE